MVAAGGQGLCVSSARAEPGLRVEADGSLELNGRPIRAVGVNYFDAFYRVLKDNSDTSYEQGFAALADHGIPFCRVMFSGFWPIEWQLYFTDKSAYFAHLDAVVASAEQHDIGLIPCLFWAFFTVPDLVGEPCNRLGDPNSATIAFIRQYTMEVVTRYKDSPAIWAWEMGNEYSNIIDLPNADQNRPPTYVNLGNPATRSDEDELTHDMMVVAMQEFANVVRQYDPHRPIEPGHATPRPSAWHQRTELTWVQDTRAEYQTSLLDQTPDPMNMASIHFYPPGPERFGEGSPPPASELLQLSTQAVRTQNKALFVGEFGVSATAFEGDPVQIEAVFRDTLAAIVASDADLAAMWVYDHDNMEGTWNVSTTNDRSWMLVAVGEANDTDADGVNNYVDACPDTPPGVAVDASGCAVLAPDYDGDLDVDQSDFGRMQRCFTTGMQPPSAGCEWADFNGDSHVDADDVAIFVGCFSGPDVPADLFCTSQP